MAHVTLVALVDSADLEVDDSLSPFEAVLKGANHDVELLVIGERGPGMADGAVRGLRSATGEIILLIDLARPYTPADVLAVAAPLISGEADVTVGCPGRARISARLLSPVARTVDPWSGLVGVRREVVAHADGRLRPVGERFALEIVQRAEGRRADVALPDRPGDSPRGWHLDDVRHLKRLADDRLGMISRLAQFCVVGASGMIIDLTLYAALQWKLHSTPLATRTLPVLGSPLDLAVAGLISVSTALLWNFSLNRRLTFNDARKSSIVGQFVTYVLSNALGISISLTLRLALPRWLIFFENHKLAAAVVGIVASTGVSFAMARWLVFPGQGGVVARPDAIELDQPRREELTPSDSTPVRVG